MKIPLIVAFFLFTIVSSYSQSAQIHIDSIYSESEIDEFINEGHSNKDSLLLGKAYFLEAINDRDNNVLPAVAVMGYKKSGQYFLAINDNLNAYNAYKQAGVTLIDEEQYEDAIPVFMRIDSLLDSSFQAERAEIMDHLSNCYFKTKSYQKGIEAIDIALLFYINKKNDYLIANLKLRKAKLLYQQEQYDRSIENAKQSLKLATDLKKLSLVSQNLQVLGLCNFEKGRFKTAIDNLLEAERFALKTDDREVLQDIYKDISLCYEELGNYKEALYYSTEYSALSETILTSKCVSDKADLRKKFFSQKTQAMQTMSINEKRRAELNSRRDTITFYSILVGLGTILLASFFIIRMYQQRLNSQDIINIQQEELNTQKIKELENNLKMESMYSMMEGQEKERERIAKDLHDSLGGLLSTVKLQFESLNINKESNIKNFDNANHLLDQACQEVREISRNLQPSALMNLGLVPAVNDLINRFNDSAYPGIDFQHYNMDKKLENSIALNVYRIIQELIYNAIKHARANEILVQITRQKDELIVMVEDDGIGFKPGQVKKGMGTENISSRVNFLNGELTVHSSQNKGTNVLINIPLSKS